MNTNFSSTRRSMNPTSAAVKKRVVVADSSGSSSTKTTPRMIPALRLMRTCSSLCVQRRSKGTTPAKNDSAKIQAA